MPSLIPPAITAGSLSAAVQPSFRLGGGSVLRPWLLTDAEAVRTAFEDPEIQRWHIRRADSVDEARGWIEAWRKDWERETAGHWAVADAEDDRLLGRLSLRDWDLEYGWAEVAYWTTPAARGRGVCTRAVTGLTDWAFTTAGFDRLELSHSIANPASCRVASKAGFAAEGVRRAAGRHLDGLHDMHLHGRVRQD
ncbi:GNAT family N-acetyltransferase [Streptomyces sp. NPDC060198]|uniref:GNAT family N-acetyltransferase n=1 Tax=Streptomyces sp. NPDC060198 TaxID=3347070 RepID=UPI00365F5D11